MKPLTLNACYPAILYRKYPRGPMNALLGYQSSLTCCTTLTNGGLNICSNLDSYTVITCTCIRVCIVVITCTFIFHF